MIGHVDKKKATDPNDRNEAVEWPMLSSPSEPAAYRPSHSSILRPIEKSAGASSTIVVDLHRRSDEDDPRGDAVVPNNVDALEWLRKQLEVKGSDLLREMVRTFAEG
jgi:hypothetical protein